MGKQTLLGDGGKPRPDDCTCSEFELGDADALPCFACFVAGFETRPPEVDDE